MEKKILGFPILTAETLRITDGRWQVSLSQWPFLTLSYLPVRSPNGEFWLYVFLLTVMPVRESIMNLYLWCSAKRLISASSPAEGPSRGMPSSQPAAVLPDSQHSGSSLQTFCATSTCSRLLGCSALTLTRITCSGEQSNPTPVTGDSPGRV